MNKCPICKRELISTIFDIFNEKHCPVHGEFFDYEANNSLNYFNFKANIFSLRDLLVSIRYFRENKSSTQEIEKYYDKDEIEKIYDSRVNNLLKNILLSFSIQSKISLEEYAKSIYDKSPIKKLEDDNKDIIEQHKIQIYQGSKAYTIFSLLKDLRDYCVHPYKKHQIIKNSEILSDIVENTEHSNIFEIFRSIVYVKTDANRNQDVIFTLKSQGIHKSKKDIEEDIFNSPVSGMNINSSGMILLEYIIDTLIKIVQEIDLKHHK